MRIKAETGVLKEFRLRCHPGARTFPASFFRVETSKLNNCPLGMAKDLLVREPGEVQSHG